MNRDMQLLILQLTTHRELLVRNAVPRGQSLQGLAVLDKVDVSKTMLEHDVMHVVKIRDECIGTKQLDLSERVDIATNCVLDRIRPVEQRAFDELHANERTPDRLRVVRSNSAKIISVRRCIVFRRDNAL